MLLIKIFEMHPMIMASISCAVGIGGTLVINYVSVISQISYIKGQLEQLIKREDVTSLAVKSAKLEVVSQDLEKRVKIIESHVVHSYNHGGIL